jgi:hypothetical protein
MSGGNVSIGVLAERSGVNPKTIRYYETVGVLPPPKWGKNRYRRYSEEAVGLPQFIRKAQGLASGCPRSKRSSNCAAAGARPAPTSRPSGTEIRRPGKPQKRNMKSHPTGHIPYPPYHPQPIIPLPGIIRLVPFLASSGRLFLRPISPRQSSAWSPAPPPRRRSSAREHLGTC